MVQEKAVSSLLRPFHWVLSTLHPSCQTDPRLQGESGKHLQTVRKSVWDLQTLKSDRVHRWQERPQGLSGKYELVQLFLKATWQWPRKCAHLKCACPMMKQLSSKNLLSNTLLSFSALLVQGR